MTLCPPLFQLIFIQIVWFWQEKIKTYGWSFSASQKVSFILSYKDICDLHVELLSLQSLFELYATLTGKSESVSLDSLSTYHTGLYFPEMVGQCTAFRSIDVYYRSQSKTPPPSKYFHLSNRANVPSSAFQLLTGLLSA